MKQDKPADTLSVSSVTLAASDLELLAYLAKAASAQLGQSISKSQIMRALIRSHGTHGDQHDLHGELMRELVAGRVWGTVPASRKSARAAVTPQRNPRKTVT